ncbi:flocculation protein FLO11 [Fopius arisanus]|uniref:Flocculation protein FLO11 n=2 Tax=Fopius arisanus TaxID=64838 RepID=A0A9R1U7F6_9HYME|nr:PREDICTED: flocculation protein FLO11 [Fopius arisanus]
MSICRGAKVVPHRRLFHPKWYQCCLAMVCKENVESWFRNLSSYSRIDVMCSMLNMCLPFEVRYLGTYVEDRGKRDYNDLRDTEHHANNASDVSELSTLGVGDTRTRRKLILYISLLHGCNYSCAEILYKILGSLDDQEIDSILNGTTVNQEQKDEQPLEELLLLYTMAHYHPGFSFDQKKRVGDILVKLQKEETRLNPEEPEPSIAGNDRLEGSGEMPSNCAMPPSPLPQYPPEVQMRPPLMGGVGPGMTMPLPGLCIAPGTDQMPVGPSNPQYLPLGFPSAVSPMPPWQNQTVMMTPVNQMMYPAEIPGYPMSPMVSRQSSPSQSRSPSRSNSPMARRNNSRMTTEEAEDLTQVPCVRPWWSASSRQSNVSNSGTSRRNNSPRLMTADEVEEITQVPCMRPLWSTSSRQSNVSNSGTSRRNNSPRLMTADEVEELTQVPCMRPMWSTSSRQSNVSNSGTSRRNNSPRLMTADEIEELTQVPCMRPRWTTPSRQSNISNSGTSTGLPAVNRSTPSQRVATRESPMNYSRHNDSDNLNTAAASSIDNKANKQPPPARLRSSVSGDSIRDSGEDLPNFKGNLQNYSHEEIRRLSDEDLRDIGLTPNAVGQLRNIVRSQTTNGLSSQPSVSLPEKKPEVSAPLNHPPPSPLPPADCEVVQNNDQLNETSAMKASPLPQPLPELYQPLLHHHHHHNNHNLGGIRRYPTMPPLDPSQIPQMYTTPPPTLYPTQNPCYACFPVSGIPTRFTRCPSQHMYCLTHLQTLRLDDSSRQGSQSSSSDSTGSRSPPETPPAAPWVNSNATTTVMNSPTSTGTITMSSITPGGTIVSSSSSGVIPTSVITTATATTTTPVTSDGYNPPEHNQGSIVTHQTGHIPQMSDRPRHRKGHMMRHKNQMINGAPAVNMAPCISAFPVSGHSQMTFLPHGHVSLRPNTAMYPSFSGYRPSYPGSFQSNGEIMFPYPPPTTGGTPPPPTMPPSTVTVVVPSPAPQSYMPPASVVPFTATVQQPKISCYNCGSSSHHPGDCKDQTMEDLTKRAPYRLDYSTAKQPADCLNDK